LRKHTKGCSRLQNSRWAGLRIGFLCAVLLGLLTSLRWLNRLDNGLSESLFALRGSRPADPAIVIVALDAASEHKQPLPWPAEVWQQALLKLLAAQPKVIALDVPDVRKVLRGSPRELQHMAQVLAGQPLVWACAVQQAEEEIGAPAKIWLRFACSGAGLPEPPWPPTSVLLPPSELLPAVAGLGAVNIYPDLDGMARALPLMVAFRQLTFPSLVLEVVRVAQGLPPGMAKKDKAYISLGETAYPVLPSGEMLINFAGGYMHYPYVSFRTILEEPPAKLRVKFYNRYVLIGPTTGGLTTYWRTPLSPRLPGVELQANALENVLRQNYLRPVPLAVWLPALFVLCMAVGWLTAVPRVMTGFLLTLILTFLATMAFYIIFLQGFWLPWGALFLGVVGTGLFVVFRQASLADISRIRAEERLQERLQEIAHVGRLVDSSLNRQQLLTQIMQWVAAELNVEACSLLLVSEDRKWLKFEIALGPKGDYVKDIALAMGEGIAGMVAQTGQPIISNAARRDPRHEKAIAEALEYPVYKLLCVPMTLHGTVIGVIEAMNKRDGADFTEQDCSLLTVIAQQAALFLEISRLYNELQQRVEFANAELITAMRELRAEKARIETLVEELVDGVIAVDRQQRIILINSAARQMFALGEEAVEGRPVADILKQAEILELLAQPFQQDTASVTREIDLQGDGSFVIRASAAWITGPDGLLIGQCIVCTDITHFKKMDQMKTDLMSFVSHELKTPITAISLYGQLLNEKLEAGDIAAARELAASIDRQTVRMRHMVEDFLNLARIEAGRPLEMLWEKIPNVRQFVEETVHIEARMTQEHQFIFQLPPTLPPLWADRSKLEEVFLNLVNNAIKYSPGGGVITIAAQPENNMIRFSISDQGIGIAPEAQMRLFQRFQRVGDKHAIRGTGVGLFICKVLIEAHGGRIWVESEEGKGSTFYFTVPIYQGQDQDARREQSETK